MPILARLDLTGPRARIAVDHETRRLDFASIDGAHVLDLGDSSFVARSGVMGLRVPPRRIRTSEFPGLDGARLAQVSTGPREVVVPLFVVSDLGVTPHLDQLAQVREFMDYRTADYATREGTFDLRATGQDGAIRRLRCLYVDGMEGSEGASSGSGGNWSSFDVKLLAVDPYWHGEPWSTPSVGLPTVVPFLSNDIADAFPRQLAPSVAIGEDMPLHVPGDLPSSPVIELIGPATSTTITAPSGLSVTIGTLASDDVFVLDTGRAKRATLNGDDAWELIGQSPRWPALQPGETTISIVMAGATSASRARVYGEAMWETAW